MGLLGNNRKGQTWSFDLIVAVVLFVIIVGVFYAFLTADSNEDKTEFLEDGALALLSEFNCEIAVNSSSCVVEDGVLNQSLLSDLGDMSYEDLRTQLNIPGDFCLYIKDGNGNLVPLQLSDTITGLGSTELELFQDEEGTTYYCGQELP